MNEIAQTLVDALLEREAAAGAIITWANNAYPCSGGAEGGGNKFDIGGFKLMDSVPIVVRTAVLPAVRPKEKQRMAYTSTPGAIPVLVEISSITMLHNEIMVMDCKHAARGS